MTDQRISFLRHFLHQGLAIEMPSFWPLKMVQMDLKGSTSSISNAEISPGSKSLGVSASCSWLKHSAGWPQPAFSRLRSFLPLFLSFECARFKRRTNSKVRKDPIIGGRPFRNACFSGLKLQSTDHERSTIGVHSDDSNSGHALLLSTVRGPFWWWRK